jgi:glycosyltransferase involved in cell wall biosynthesis
MKISILHPSRSRPEQALSAAIHWLGNTSYKHTWEYILSVDSSDPELLGYRDLVGDPRSGQIIINDNKNVVQAANQAAKVASGEILVLISDDFMCFKNWDVAVIEALEGKSGVLKTYDGIQKWIVTLPIMTRDYYESQGYIYHPSYFHMFSDSDQTHKADLQKKLIIRNDIVFKHNHYSIGGQPKDEVNKKADSTWAQGEKVYLQRCKEKFGLGNVNIYDLSPEATKAGHVAWLKKKLR